MNKQNFWVSCLQLCITSHLCFTT